MTISVANEKLYIFLHPYVFYDNISCRVLYWYQSWEVDISINFIHTSCFIQGLTLLVVHITQALTDLSKRG